MQKPQGVAFNERMVEKLMEMAIAKFEKDPDLTLSIANSDFNKSLSVCLPHLFKPSTLCSKAPKTSYYENILDIILMHLRSREEPSLCLF